MAERAELWKRDRVAGTDTRFVWMVWEPGSQLGGESHWFTDSQEDEARGMFERLAETSRAGELEDASTPKGAGSSVG
jgi:hypothetical protein